MGLEELQKKLYQEKKESARLAEQKEPVKVPPAFSSPLPKLASSNWRDENSNFLAERKKRRIFLAAAILIFLAVAALTGWFLWRGFHSFDTKSVTLEIFGQERIVGGEEINFVVRYKNNTKVILQKAILTFVYSKDSLPEAENLKNLGDLVLSERDLGSLNPGQEGQTEFKAKVLGDKDSSQKFSAQLVYRPANFNSEFSNESEFETTIVAVPIVLNFDLPEKVVSSQDLNFSLQYINTSETEFSDLKIKIDWPGNFVFSSAYPEPSAEKNIWDLKKLVGRQEGKIMVNGVLSGSEGDDKIFRAQVGVEKDGKFVIYSQTIKSTLISASPLWLEQSLVGANSASADLGQVLNYNLKYRNTTEVPLGPVIIKVKIEGQAADLTSVTAQKGFFDSNENAIIWNVSNLSALEKLEGKSEGDLNFSFKIKDRLSVNSFSDKNFSVLTLASIDSANVPLELSGTKLGGENKLAVKINSRVIFYQRGYYQDNLIPNSGPLPPKVGEKTTYTVRWQILNISNDLSETEVSAILPNWMQWPEIVSPNDNSLKYDAQSHKITWQVGKLAAGTGILSLVKQIAFQIGIVPSLSQVGSSPEIIQGTKLEARDDFTGVPILLQAADLKTALTDDPAVGWDKGAVIN